MRFMERVVSAIRYHKRWYLLEAAAVLVFLLASLFLWTLRQATSDMHQGFLARLRLLTPSGAQAGPVAATVNNSYAAVDQHYASAWLILVAAALLLSLTFGWWSAHRRRSESEAYLMLGKHPWAIAGQYVMESLLTFGATCLLTLLLVFLVGVHANHLLHDQASAALSAELGRRISTSSLTQSMQTLFSHKLTEFAGPGLFFPGPPAASHLLFPLAGTLPTILGGALALAVGAGLAAYLQLSQLRRRLLRSQALVRDHQS